MIANLINDSITKPMFIVEHNGARKFFTTFKDENDEMLYLVSITEKDGEIDLLKSNYRPIKRNGKVDYATIKKLIKVEDDKVVYDRYSDGNANNYPNTNAGNAVSNEQIVHQQNNESQAPL